tara:strand:+ start:419 stop:991 length:573 start_codon:yes stop_codon:yes gene_type:complete
MEISEAVLEMKNSISQRDWDGLEKHYVKVAEDSDIMASDLVARMYALDFRSYEDAIQEGLVKAFEKAQDSDDNVQAIYFQFSLFKMWRSQFQLCEDYIPDNKLNDAWAHDYLSRVRGPSFPILSDLYQRTNLLEEGQASLAVGLALVAKTVASVGRAFDRFSEENQAEFPYAFCASFSGQDPVFRIAELA